MAEPGWRTVMLGAGLEFGLDALTDLALAALTRELPVLGSDPDLLEGARRSAAANVELLVTLVQDPDALEDLDPPAAAVAFAHELARRQVPVAELGRAYRVGQHALWRWAVDELRARITDPASVAIAVEELSDAAFRTGDVFSTIVMERYTQERERWLRSGEAVRAATVQELLDGRPVDIAAAGRRLGYELTRVHQAFVVWSDADDGVPETAAAALGGPRALVVRRGAGIVAGWAPADAIDLSAVVPEAGTHVAFGSRGRDLTGFRGSHHEAMEARRVTRLTGPGAEPVHYASVALLALLTQDLPQARAFVTATLGPLATSGSRTLATTLRTLLEEQGSPRRAGHRLGVHENTVAKRREAIDRLLAPEDRAPAGTLLAALTLLDALGPA